MSTATNQTNDRQLITETIHKFCHCIDTKVPLSKYPGCMEEVFTKDFAFGLSREPCKNGDNVQLQPMGLDKFSAFIEQVQIKYEATHHHCTNTIITFNGNDEASAKTYATNYHLKQEKHGGGRFNYYGVYEDELRRTNDGWRIKSRKQYPLFSEGTIAPNE